MKIITIYCICKFIYVVLMLLAYDCNFRGTEELNKVSSLCGVPLSSTRCDVSECFLLLHVHCQSSQSGKM